MAVPKFYKNTLAILSIISLLALAALAESKGEASSQKWLNHGGDIYNRRYAEDEVKISPETVSNLRLKWRFVAGSDISATPAIYQGTLYFPSWDGYLYAIRSNDGSLLWKQYLQNLTGLEPPAYDSYVNLTVSRSTPTVAENLLIVGIYGPAVVIAVKQSTGELVWSTQLDSHNTSVITMSGTFYEGAVYIGTSSSEEVLSIDQCCTFRGSFSKLDIRTGEILWQTFMLPDNNGQRGEYAGAAIWGSSPSIDEQRNLVYIATGNLYSVPPSVEECQEIENNQTFPSHPDSCIGPDIHSESILALDLDTGGIRWSHQLGGYDVWFFACNNLSTPNCPPGPNPDADFGEAPMMLTVNVNGRNLDIVVATQKSGFTWALTRDNGSLLWSTEAGPGGLTGGGIWGMATDKQRVYTNIANARGRNFTLKPTTKVVNSGGWVAMDPRTGQVLWSTANPKNASSLAPVTAANGVVFAGSAHGTGPFYAMDAKTGKILWSYDTGASVYGGASVSDGCVFFGHGYFNTFTPTNTAGNSLFAFCV